MFATLAFKELKAIALSPKFSVTFGVCSALILLSIFAGIREYQTALANWQTATALADQQATEASSWRQFSYHAEREPDPMMIFVTGLSNDIGRWSRIATDESIKLRHSPYSDDPIFAFFRTIDFSFITLVVLSLFAILFTYDAINGERESGTLKLVLSNAVPRATYVLAKLAGAWLALVAPLLAPILIGLLLVILAGIPLSGALWLKIITLIGVSLALVSLFVTFGVFISALTRHSSVSFLMSLVIWVGIVLVIPRAGVMAAGALQPVPRVAEIEGQRDGFAKDLWAEFYAGMDERFKQERENGFDPDDDAAMWERMQREDSLRKFVEARIYEYEERLLADLEVKKAAQEQLAFTLSRISPGSAYQLAMMRLAGNDITLKQRYQRAMSDYRDRWTEFVTAKQEETGEHGGFVSVSIDSEKGLTIGTGSDDEALDVSGMPRFTAPKQAFAEVFAPIIPDLGILGFGILVSFAGAFVAFLRYDVR
ncbi:MAG TPA: ABC transporter permease subunit [candidate division Zixibacteria bacterium]|nr:ABC transporter permease subunit [candidate division Zixibacteria bacterium]